VNNGRTVRLIFTVLFVILFFFLGRHSFVVISPIMGKISSCILYPFLVVQNKITTPLKNYCVQKNDIAALRSDLESCKLENEALLKENLALKGAATQYKNIKELLEFYYRYTSEKALLGQIFLRQFSTQADFFFVNKGTTSGVKENMVAVHGNSIIGRVQEVYPWYCRVIAVTDRRCKVAAYCDKTGALGIHGGINKVGEMNLAHVSHLDVVEQDDLVFSTGEGLVFPRGFCLGRITAYKKEGLWYKISTESLVDLQAITDCVLVDKSDLS